VLFLTPIFLSAVYLSDFHRASHASGIAVREIALAALHSTDGNVEQRTLRAIRDLSIPALELTGTRLPVRLERVDTNDIASGVERAANILLTPARLSGSVNFDVPRWQQRRTSTGVSMGSTTLIGVPFDIPIALRGDLVFSRDTVRLRVWFKFEIGPLRSAWPAPSRRPHSRSRRSHRSPASSNLLCASSASAESIPRLSQPIDFPLRFPVTTI
jgi:hypothetical protein